MKALQDVTVSGSNTVKVKKENVQTNMFNRVKGISTVDLNTVTDGGIYRFAVDSGNESYNAPSAYGTMIVIADIFTPYDWIYQIFLSHYNGVFYRRSVNNGKEWGAWNKFTTTAV